MKIAIHIARLLLGFIYLASISALVIGGFLVLQNFWEEILWILLVSFWVWGSYWTGEYLLEDIKKSKFFKKVYGDDT